VTVERAIKNLETVRENQYLKTALGFGSGTMKIIGNSAPMQKVFQMVSKIAQDDKATVLIEGETGTARI